MSAIRNQYAIVEPLITTINYDGIEFDCYGDTDADGPELRQIALHNTSTDLFDLLDNAIIQNIAGMLEWQWLQDKLQASTKTAPLCFGNQAH